MYGLLKPGQRLKILRRRALLHGPAINATSYLTVAMTYSRMMYVLCKYYINFCPYPKNPAEAIAAASEFDGKYVICRGNAVSCLHACAVVPKAVY